MSKIIHIYSSSEEIKEIFAEGLKSLDRAMECFMMIEKQDPPAALVVKDLYTLIHITEFFQSERK